MNNPTPSETTQTEKLFGKLMLKSNPTQAAMPEPETAPTPREETVAVRLIARLTAERDAAIRERDAFHKQYIKFEDLYTQAAHKGSDALFERDKALAERDEARGKLEKVKHMVNIAGAADDAKSDMEVALSATFSEAMALDHSELVEAERDEALKRAEEIEMLAVTTSFQRDALASQVAKLEGEVEAEQGRWQEAIGDLLWKLSGKQVDGKGCDSGDPLDVTLTELRLSWPGEELQSLASQVGALSQDKARLDWFEQVGAMPEWTVSPGKGPLYHVCADPPIPKHLWKWHPTLRAALDAALDTAASGEGK